VTQESPKPARAVLFDLDGTLADTLDSIAHAVNACLGETGVPPRPVDDYRYLVGDGLPTLCRRVLRPTPGGASPERVEELRQKIMVHYDRHLLDRARLYPGIPELLATLSARGTPMAVVSNKPDRHTRAIVDAFIPADTFAVVMGQKDGVPKKPDPAGALQAAEILGVPPEECLFVGDTSVDMETALAAGMTAVGVLWGFRGREELERHGAAVLVSEPKKIAALVV
jgi:phosphoglycolate phosphatase